MKFKTRARALDMLGRQQVRGIPTALSELMKNAHDAYATEVRIDLLRHKNMLVIRDNGVGMSEKDFAERWLTLGTESKVAPRPAPPGFERRPQLGEKGIGRLAMATIGPQVLVLTRSASSKGVFAALINWRVFEDPSLDLDQVEIETCEVGDWGRIAEELSALRARAAGEIHTLSLEGDRAQLLSVDVAAFPLDSVELGLRLPGPVISSKGTGTQFFISPIEETIEDTLTESGEEASELVQDLAGFANPLDRTGARLAATFWDWEAPGETSELIGAEAFWSEEDLKDADHEVNGAFDGRGIFKGRVRVYDRWTQTTVQPRGLRVSETACGPFSIRFGYVQGRQQESRLDPPRWAQITRKLDRIAGLYVYRDGIRILPYGRHKFDWLDIERNRTKSASYYFFSYRRIFGYVAITRSENTALSEKAGREGFRENKAYREFQRLLSDLFVQLAADFFREGGGAAAYFVLRKGELRQEEAARREHEKRTSGARRAFGRALGQKQRELMQLDVRQAAVGILSDATVAFEATSEPGQSSLIFQSSVQRLEEIRRRFELDLPAGVGLSDETLRDWEAYKGDRGVAWSILGDAERELRRLVSLAPGPTPTSSDPLLSEVLDRALLRTHEAAEAATREARNALARIEEACERLQDDLKALSAPAVAEPVDQDERVQAVRELAERNERLLLALRVAASQLDLTEVDGQLLAPTDIVAAGDQELLRLRDQAERDLELSQLGLAVEVVGHEFRATIRAIRRELRALGAWAKKNRGGLLSIHSGLVTSFDHLDSYLTLFTPLQRRVRTAPTTLSGGEIAKFIRSLFGDRLRKENVTLSVTDAFKRHQFEGSPATFYPVFVNLVDNAIFWTSRRDRERSIRLDRHGDSLVIEDSGPGILDGDLPYVFDAGFTRKPGGRGLGLYISREVLRRHDYDLSAARGVGGGARFEIRPRTPE